MGLLGNPHEDPGTAETWGIVTWFLLRNGEVEVLYGGRDEMAM